ncbi:sur7 protein [Colletotrichum truncatum]|uniref:Sur7 protein n=1 Tax=Colletotrichum truncatum TaxID=5467 RepID=A0ACC3YXV1_COLTU|nr:sur7 protein [Colletotrichum truncatum]KAF6790906.1 sur7 protein [Colletotrichum truncatum]
MVGIGGRITAIIPIIASAVAVALSIVLLTAGSSTSSGNTNYWLSLNTSKVGQQLIKIEAANNTNGNGNGNGNGGLPGLPGLPTPTIPGLPQPSDPTGITSGLNGILGGLLGNLTNAVGNGVEDLEGQLMGNLTQALGVKDTYNLFLSKMCEGNYANENDPKSKTSIISCSSYDDKGKGLRNITDSIPSSFVIATANVSVPLVSALRGTIDQVVSLATTGAKAMMALLAIGTACAGITLLATLPIIIVGFWRVLVIVSLIFSMIAATVLPLFAAVTTGIVIGGKHMLDKQGDAFGIQIRQGGPFIAMSWVAAVASMAAATYWFMMWFVSFRRTAFSRRKRTENEIGNWGGIFREVKADLKTWETSENGGEK